uniref:Uncharacterized protein n=1 Tax=Physcomitrium patens TaxID=3218 RepID=A0A2K1J956_PHYPA|nr:hypothetical protein PHYPA_021173 [Physcomitrium patens]
MGETVPWGLGSVIEVVLLRRCSRKLCECGCGRCAVAATVVWDEAGFLLCCSCFVERLDWVCRSGCSMGRVWSFGIGDVSDGLQKRGWVMYLMEVTADVEDCAGCILDRCVPVQNAQMKCGKCADEVE